MVDVSESFAGAVSADRARDTPRSDRESDSPRSDRESEELPKQIKDARQVVLIYSVCTAIFLGSLLVPGLVMLSELQSLNPLHKYGELGGLEAQPDACTITAVFHRPVAYDVPHHHHVPSDGHSASGRSRRLNDYGYGYDEPQVQRHQHVPT